MLPCLLLRLFLLENQVGNKVTSRESSRGECGANPADNNLWTILFVCYVDSVVNWLIKIDSYNIVAPAELLFCCIDHWKGFG